MFEENIKYNDVLEELFEYKKLTKKLENELFSKENELLSIKKSYNELKSSSENITKDLNNKISMLEKNNSLLEEKIILQNQKVIKSNDNLKDIINSISTLKKEDIDKKLLELEKEKNAEISSLRNKIITLTQEKINIESELKFYHINKYKELNEKEKIYQDMNDNNNIFLNSLKNERNEMYQNILKEMKNLNIKNDNQIMITTVIENLKKEKKNYIKDIENIQQNHLEEIKDLESKNIILINKLNDLNNKLSYKDLQLIDIQKKIDKMNITYNNLENNNNILLKENNFLKEEGNELKKTLDELKNLIEQRELEFLEIRKNYDNNIKKLNNEINNYQDILKNKEKENNELQNKYNNMVEEKRLLDEKIDKFIQDQNELNIVNIKDNNKIIKKYVKDKYIIEKDEEINSLNNYISKIKKEYFQAIDKKKYYKVQCKILNEKLKIINNNLTEQQIKKIKDDILAKGLN